MKYKVLLMDIDNTIVPTDGKLVDRSLIDKIKQAQKVLHVGVATGRSMKEATEMLGPIKLQGPSIFASGAQVIDPATGEIYKEDILNFAQLTRASEIADKHGYELRVYDDGVDRAITEDIKKPITAFVMALKPDEVGMLADEFLSIGNVVTHKTISATAGCYDMHIAHKDASKDKAIKRLAEVLIIGTDEIIGVGDGPNDVLLLQACGFKVVMGNASDELKKMADYIAPSVKEAGVADVIDKFVL